MFCRALLEDLHSVIRCRALLGTLVRRELAARHAGSVIGVGWAYVQPLLVAAAYYLMFDVVFKMRLAEGAPTHAVGAFLIVGLLPWMAFAESLSRAMSSLVDAADLLQKNPLPFVLFPARAVLSTAVTHLPLMALLLIGYWPFHQGGLGLFALPVFVIGQMTIALLLGYLLAILCAAMRDVSQLVGFALTLGVFISPIMFPASMFPERFRWVLWVNPMTGLVEGYQAIFLAGKYPPAQAWGGMFAWILIGALILDRLIAHSREQLVDWL